MQKKYFNINESQEDFKGKVFTCSGESSPHGVEETVKISGTNKDILVAIKLDGPSIRYDQLTRLIHGLRLLGYEYYNSECPQD